VFRRQSERDLDDLYSFAVPRPRPRRARASRGRTIPLERPRRDVPNRFTKTRVDASIPRIARARARTTRDN